MRPRATRMSSVHSRSVPATYSGLRVIAFTAHRMADEEPQLREAGFDGVLVKPASLQDLRAVCMAQPA